MTRWLLWSLIDTLLLWYLIDALLLWCLIDTLLLWCVQLYESEEPLREFQPCLLLWCLIDALLLLWCVQLYESEEPLREFQPCLFKTNLRLAVDSPRLVLKKRAQHELQNFYAHWSVTSVSQ